VFVLVCAAFVAIGDELLTDKARHALQSGDAGDSE
jgi:hypothetical protein